MSDALSFDFALPQTASIRNHPARYRQVSGEGLQEIVLETFPLESGRVLSQVPVAFRTFGKLDPDASNAVVVCHALTGDTAVDRWWSELVGPGKVFDTDRLFVVCANVLGSPYGSASPLTVDPGTGRPYGPSFPEISVRDTVSAHREVLRHLGVREVKLALGGSLGGMQALEWAFHADIVRSVVVVAAGAVHSPWSIAWGEAQRQAIFADPDWQNGHYAPDRPPSRGLSVARMMAMVSYRSSAEFRDRFGRDRQGDRFHVESYLHHHGQKLLERFDANCYVHLTRQMDSHDVGRGRGSVEAALASIEVPVLVVGFPSDILYPLEEQVELASLVPRGSLEVLSAPFGHDSFLVDGARLASALGPFVRRHVLP
jgi:homoserine O-acetyltransferase